MISALATPTPSEASFAMLPLSSGRTATTGGPEAAAVVPRHSVLVRAPSTTTSTAAPAATTLQRGRRTLDRRTWAAAEGAVPRDGDAATPDARVASTRSATRTASVGMSVRLADSDTSSRRICAMV